MASLFSLDPSKESVSVLDPGSGSGILSIALLERLEKEGYKNVDLVCFENDGNIIKLLEENLESAKKALKLNLNYEIRTDNYILSQEKEYNNSIEAKEALKVDFVIANPPYLKKGKDSLEAKAMSDVCHGSPNKYFLFAQMSAFNLKEGGEMVYIIPRSWTSGSYFAAFRKSFFSLVSLEHIHQFVSRDKVFECEDVLQETIIIKAGKRDYREGDIVISTSDGNNDFNSISSFSVHSEDIIWGKERYVFIPTNPDDLGVLKKINRYQNTLLDLGLKMKTGIVIDFRHQEHLRKRKEKGTVPLFYSQHIKNGIVHHNPSGKGTDWIATDKPSLIQKNKNYLFCKRFTAKEERRRLQCGIYLASAFEEYKYIATQNKINFIDYVDGSEMDLALTYGLYALFNRLCSIDTTGY